MVAGIALQAESFQQNLQKQSVVREVTFLQIFLIIQVILSTKILWQFLEILEGKSH